MELKKKEEKIITMANSKEDDFQRANTCLKTKVEKNLSKEENREGDIGKEKERYYFA